MDMKKNVLKSGLLALALTLLTSAVDATNPTTNDSNKRELILSVISSVPQIWTS